MFDIQRKHMFLGVHKSQISRLHICGDIQHFGNIYLFLEFYQKQKQKTVKHDDGNVVQIGNALYLMALWSKSQILASLIQYFKSRSKISHWAI